MATARMTVDLTWTGASGSPGVNVWHLRSDQQVGPFTEFEDLSGFVQDFYTTLQEYFPESLNIQFFGELNGVGDDSGSIYTIPSWGLAGSGGESYMPPANCMLASWRAQTGGRSGRGRTFLGPLVAAASESNGTPAEAARTAVQGAIADLIESSDGFANGAVGVYSRTQDVFRDYVAGDCPNYFAVLRSRRD